jgi:hypothetical protein
MAVATVSHVAATDQAGSRMKRGARVVRDDEELWRSSDGTSRGEATTSAGPGARAYLATIFASYIQTFSSARGVHSIQLATP